MSVPVLNSQPVLQACVLEAVQHSAALLAQLLATASQSLSDQAQSSSASALARQQAEDALRLLQAQEPVLHRAFPLALLECFAQDQMPASTRPSSTARLDVNSLSLVDEKEHHAQVELQRAQEQVTHATDAALAELNALVSAAQGLHRVQAERNPLRPENYLRALQRALNECTAITAPVRETWMQHLLSALGPALRDLYQHTSQILRQQGIVPVGYGMASSRYASPYDPGSSYGAGLAASAQASLNAQAAQAQEDALTASILHQLLQGGADPYSTLQPTWEPSPVASLYGRMPSSHPAVQAAEVVAQMMDNIAQDGRLHPVVRQNLQSTEPAIGQLAGHDPTFFSNPLHPARRLLDELTERGLALGADNAPGLSRFVTLLQQINHYLGQQDTRQPAPFATALQLLEQTCAQWAQQDQPPPATPAPQAVEGPSPQQRLSQEVAANIRQLPDIGAVPSAIMQFATGPWAKVIAQTQLAQPDSSDGDPHGYLALVPLLFWSVRPGIALDERRQIIQAVPEMLHTLRRGLTQFGYPAPETDRFLARLQQIHQQTLACPAPVPSSASAPARPPAPAVPASPDVDIELDFELESAHGIPAELAAMPSPAPAAVVAHGDFPLGTWFELQSHRQVMRTQLTWASPKGTLFLFTGVDGSTQSMTRRIRDRLLTEGTLRLVAAA